MSLVSNSESGGLHTAAPMSSATAANIAHLQKRVDDLSEQLSAVQHMAKFRYQDFRVSLLQELRDFVQQQEQQHLKELRDEIDSLREQTRLTGASLMQKAAAPHDNPDKLKDVMATIERIVQEQEHLSNLQEATNVEAVRATIQSILADMGLPSSSEKYGSMGYANKEPNIDKHDELAIQCIMADMGLPSSSENDGNMAYANKEPDIINLEELAKEGETRDDLVSERRLWQISKPKKSKTTLRKAQSQEDKPMDKRATITSFLKDDFDAIIESYVMKESVWEVTCLIGFPCITCPSILIVSALISALVQLIICMVVFTNMSDGDGFDDSVKHNLQHWRAWVGHWKGNADSDTRTSLMAKVCKQDFTAYLGALQFGLYGDVSLFLNADGNLFNGEMLSYIAVACWLVLVLDDLREIISLHIAIHCVPRGPPRIVWTDDDALKVRSYSSLQVRLLSFFVFVPRAFITLFLAFTGCQFLGHTSKIGELVLNTTALSFVLDLDRLFWQLLIPYRAKAVVSKLLPFEHPAFSFVSFMRDRTGGFWMYLSIIVLSAFLLLVHFTVLYPFHEEVRAIENVMCGGNVNFVWETDPMTGNINVSSTNPVGSAGPHTPTISKVLSYACDGVTSATLVEEGHWMT